MNREQNESDKQPLPFVSPTTRKGAKTTGNSGLDLELAFFRTANDVLQQAHMDLERHTAMFRDELRLYPDQCERVIDTLKAIRQQAHSVVRTLNAGTLHPSITYPSVFSSHLETLDGEAMGRLILRVDAFQAICDATERDTERINKHVALQRKLEEMQDTLSYTLHFLVAVIQRAEADTHPSHTSQ